MIDFCINNGSGWIIELIDSQYINILTYRPLSGRSYKHLPVELKRPKKGLIDIENKDKKSFLWCHVRHINPSKEYPERIWKNDKEIIENVIMMKLSFLCKKNILTRLK